VLALSCGFWVKTKTNKQENKSVNAGSEPTKYSKTESEKWQAKAVETAWTFLPSECPLVGHVISSYQKHHSIISQPIPEDQELDDELAFIRPLNETKQDSVNYHQIIKSHMQKARQPPQSVLSLESKPAQNKRSSNFYSEIQQLMRPADNRIPKAPKRPDVDEKPKRLPIYDRVLTDKQFDSSKG